MRDEVAGDRMLPEGDAMSALRAGIDVAELERRSSGRFPAYVGIEMVKIEQQLVRMRLALRPEHLAPNGYLHGAVVVTLADTACGYGTLAHLPPGASSFTTVELKTNYLATVREGAIVCDATPLHMGRSTHVWDSEVRNEASGQRLAVFRCTQVILWPRS
jgi:1,4-dihydroxy-2-naphthoyl-CoA hydrolase